MAASKQQASRNSSRKSAGRTAEQPERSPKALAVPTYLKPDQVHAVATSCNALVADAFALYIKYKNFHWHMSGPHFRDYHLLLDEHAEQVFATIDVLAERVRKIGGKTLHSLGEAQSITRIPDDDDDYVEPLEMMRRLLADEQRSRDAMEQAIHVCEDNEDEATSNLIQNFIDETERRIWFLFEILQPA